MMGAVGQMDPRKLFIDQRLNCMCAYCGGLPDTRDHVPSKVLLDEPLPVELPVFDACQGCNVAFSLDEQYLACFLECVICGTSEPSSLKRMGIQRILSENAALRSRIASSCREGADGLTSWMPEWSRVQNVVSKLARGHVAYEIHALPHAGEGADVHVAPIPTLTREAQQQFESASTVGPALWPEMGSRAFLRMAGVSVDGRVPTEGWIVVQPGRYRYAVMESDVLIVRMVLSEYLACEVNFGDW